MQADTRGDRDSAGGRRRARRASQGAPQRAEHEPEHDREHDREPELEPARDPDSPNPARDPDPERDPERAPRHPPTLARLPLLAAEVASCTKCVLHETRTQTVFARGNPLSATLCIVGEAPGADEDEQGLPFVGRAGQLLDKMIGAMGLDPAQGRLRLQHPQVPAAAESTPRARRDRQRASRISTSSSRS